MKPLKTANHKILPTKKEEPSYPTKGTRNTVEFTEPRLAKTLKPLKPLNLIEKAR